MSTLNQRNKYLKEHPNLTLSYLKEIEDRIENSEEIKEDLDFLDYHSEFSFGKKYLSWRLREFHFLDSEDYILLKDTEKFYIQISSIKGAMLGIIDSLRRNFF